MSPRIKKFTQNTIKTLARSQEADPACKPDSTSQDLRHCGLDIMFVGEGEEGLANATSTSEGESIADSLSPRPLTPGNTEDITAKNNLIQGMEGGHQHNQSGFR